MTPTQFTRAGRLLFGTYWQTDMAPVIEVSRKQVKRLADGDGKMKDEYRMAIRKELRTLVADIDCLLAELSVSEE